MTVSQPSKQLYPFLLLEDFVYNSAIFESMAQISWQLQKENRQKFYDVDPEFEYVKRIGMFDLWRWNGNKIGDREVCKLYSLGNLLRDLGMLKYFSYFEVLQRSGSSRPVQLAPAVKTDDPCVFF